ncbi:enolase C-terminal domain-like protein [Pseudonocardia sp. N23]|uniref:enolase C-terminal domain-like protein n=1 Tax=Pseudonocardia sp. N23 TaxID=1987376 RepID=UPI000BFE6064|nr:enolase C-terminal domain-like protein [Pseudonocardia sp. N23]GAY12780.1 gluconate dehydratase [Pseudonocardia sp. N23]
MQLEDPGAITVTGVETLVVNAQLRNWILVKVRTNVDGLYGWGEASLNWKTRAVVGAIEDLTPMILGRDPRDIAQCLRVMTKHSYYRLGVIGATAISGIEHALWDVFGRSAGLPVWGLLGGRTRDAVRVYTHLGLGDMASVYDTVDTGVIREKATKVVEAGYDALKVVIVPYGHHLTVAAERRHVDTMMATLRDTVGPDVDVMIDFHGRTASVAAALQYIEVLAPYDPLFCEEPVQPGDTEALRAVTARSPVPIATGERLVSLREFLPILAAKAVHVAQPDLNHTGGLLEGSRIAALCDVEGVGVAPHNPNGPIAGAAALHFDVATPNFVIQEEMTGAVSWYDDVVSTPMTRVGSHWQVPTAPGFGVEVDEREAAKHPYEPEVPHSSSAVLADGTVVDW